MANATPTAVLQAQPGQSVLTAWPQVTPNGVSGQNLDILQIVDNTGGTVFVNVDSTGTVHNPAVNPTNGTRVGPFITRINTPASTAQFFADTFTNPSNLDILQVINLGGNVSYWLDYLGVAHGS
jgi:hypothetical protein